jgi:hypothetical protein
MDVYAGSVKQSKTKCTRPPSPLLLRYSFDGGVAEDDGLVRVRRVGQDLLAAERLEVSFDLLKCNTITIRAVCETDTFVCLQHSLIRLHCNEIPARPISI